MFDEQNQLSDPPTIGRILPDLTLWKPDGGLFSLSEISAAAALLVLPLKIDFWQTHLLESLARKSHEVRSEITRLVVVTRPEHLPTVVALIGDMLILSDLTGDAVLQLAPERPRLYFIDAHRAILNIMDAEAALLPLITTTFRSAD